MKWTLIAACLFGLACIALSTADSHAQVVGAVSANQAQQSAPARVEKAVPGTGPAASARLAAPGTVVASAACCKTSCSPGQSAHCGKTCTVVNSLSECAGENWHNYTFECPADKGMVCIGRECSCQ